MVSAADGQTTADDFLYLAYLMLESQLKRAGYMTLQRHAGQAGECFCWGHAAGTRMVNIVAVCRGAPGLGRVVPALTLTRTLAAVCGLGTVTFASYGAGARFLASLGETVVDLGEPDGLFIDSVAPQAILR